MTTETNYRAAPGLNASFLKQVLTYSYWKAIIPTEPTPAMLLGTAAHHAILEPDVFTDQYRVFTGDKRTKVGKQEWADLEATGKSILPGRDYNRCQEMNIAVMGHLECQRVLMGSDKEISLYFDHPEFGMPCKAQIDIYGNNTLVDLKTTADINQAQRKFFDLHYDLQLHWYYMACLANGMAVDSVQVMFVETSAPYRVALFDVPQAVLDNGRAKAAVAIKKLVEQRENALPSLITGEIEVPGWAQYEINDSPFNGVD